MLEHVFIHVDKWLSPQGTEHGLQNVITFYIGGNMKEIGKILEENRLAQNKSIEDISNITKMNINIIKNIESGNVEYFSNDLAYLRYYVKSYVSTLGIEIEDLDKRLQEATLEYTQSMDILEQEKIEQINEQIKTKHQTIKVPQGGRKRVKKVDWTLVSLISIVAIIASFLVYSLATNLLNPKENDNTPPPVVKPDDKDDGDKEEDNKVPEEIVEEASAKVNQISNNHLEVVDWDDKTTIETKFKVETWVQISVNNQVILLPHEQVDSRVFAPDEELILMDFYILNGQEVKFKETDVISIRYGIMNGNEFYVDDKKLDLDPEVAQSNSAMDLIFTLGKKAD